MEKIININIEKLPEGLYLATSDDIQGLIAQGRTISETMEIASDIAKKLIELQNNISDYKDCEITHIKLPLVVGL
jgi:predicted RNase H-like HicB family nuclease